MKIERCRRALQNAAIICALALVVGLCSSCSSEKAARSPDFGDGAVSGVASGTDYPRGRDWEMTYAKDAYLRNYAGGLQWGDYAYFDVYCTVRLLNDRKYADSELLKTASSVVQYARRRSITNVFVDFLPPGRDSSGILGSSAIAQVVWSPNGEISGHAALGDYSRHHFRVVYNYARGQRASDANPLGI
jgi:hypothetical protein